MKIEAIVKRVGEVRTGTSKTTGNKWAIRDLLLSWNDETGENYVNATIDAERFAGSAIEQGRTVQAELNFHTKLLPSGAVVNEIRVINANLFRALKARLCSKESKNDDVNN